MEEWMILSLPAALLIYGLGIFLWLFGRKTKSGGEILVFLTAFAFLAAVGIDLLSGASLREAAALTMVPLLMNLGSEGSGRRET